MKFRLFISTIFLYSTIISFAQNKEMDNPLAFYADVMSNASVAKHRSHASYMFSKLIGERLALNNSYEDGLEDLPWLFVRYDEEKTFRFISWQVKVNEEEYEYAVYYQRNGEKAKLLSLGSKEIDRRTKYHGNEIYPAIIHNIQAHEDYHLISTYRQLADGKVQKIVDILTFEEGVPSFGKSVFYENDEVLEGRGHKRVIMNYSAVASASLNINLLPEEKSIVYDHIIDVPGKLTGEGMVSVPDGTFEAYIHKGKNKWLYVSNLYEGLEHNPKNASPPSKRN